VQERLWVPVPERARGQARVPALERGLVQDWVPAQGPVELVWALALERAREAWAPEPARVQGPA
jgi:hypothetical protein